MTGQNFVCRGGPGQGPWQPKVKGSIHVLFWSWFLVGKCTLWGVQGRVLGNPRIVVRCAYLARRSRFSGNFSWKGFWNAWK